MLIDESFDTTVLEQAPRTFQCCETLPTSANILVLSCSTGIAGNSGQASNQGRKVARQSSEVKHAGLESIFRLGKKSDAPATLLRQTLCKPRIGSYVHKIHLYSWKRTWVDKAAGTLSYRDIAQPQLAFSVRELKRSPCIS